MEPPPTPKLDDKSKAELIGSLKIKLLVRANNSNNDYYIHVFVCVFVRCLMKCLLKQIMQIDLWLFLYICASCFLIEFCCRVIC